VKARQFGWGKILSRRGYTGLLETDGLGIEHWLFLNSASGNDIGCPFMSQRAFPKRLCGGKFAPATDILPGLASQAAGPKFLGLMTAFFLGIWKSVVPQNHSCSVEDAFSSFQAILNGFDLWMASPSFWFDLPKNIIQVSSGCFWEYILGIKGFVLHFGYLTFSKSLIDFLANENFDGIIRESISPCARLDMDHFLCHAFPGGPAYATADAFDQPRQFGVRKISHKTMLTCITAGLHFWHDINDGLVGRRDRACAGQ
jgi:hypothetical protein